MHTLSLIHILYTHGPILGEIKTDIILHLDISPELEELSEFWGPPGLLLPHVTLLPRDPNWNVCKVLAVF